MNPSKIKYYSLVKEALAKYKAGANITHFLREKLQLDTNTPEIIEIAYDLQSGTYIQHYHQNPSYYKAYTTELAGWISQYLIPTDTLLEVGFGEATTTVGVVQNLIQKPSSVLGFDISFSRINSAIKFWKESYAHEICSDYHFFVADLFSIPLKANSIDIVYTSHSIEPNGGREVEALKSIFRVARNKVLLFEPYYERASLEGQKRMKKHGYITDLPRAIEKAGGKLCSIAEIKSTVNPLNPTHLFDIDIQDVQHANSVQNTDSFWCDPITQSDMQKRNDLFYFSESGLIYPIINGIPCLRPENAILGTCLFHE